MSSGPLMKRSQVSVGKVAVASAATPVNLGVLGASTLGTLGLTLAGHPILGVAVLGVGALAYGALITLDLFNDRFVSKVYGLPDPESDDEPGGSELADPTIDPAEIEPRELRELYVAILASYDEVGQAIDAGGKLWQASLRDIRRRCAELVGEAGRVALRGNALSQYLGRQRADELQREIARLDDQAEQTGDDAAARSFRQAAEARRQQLDTYGQIAGLHDRIKAQLSVIQTSLDGVQARVVKLNATDVQKAATVGESISSNLDALSSDIQVLESTVDDIMKEFEL